MRYGDAIFSEKQVPDYSMGFLLFPINGAGLSI
jgi:hypothetical protein